MLGTKLILIEGLPGAGKSTSTHYLRAAIERNGCECRQYMEEDKPHPIDCLDFELAGLTGKVVLLWERFVEQAVQEPVITIIESRLWQNTAMYLYMGGYPVDEIVDFNRRVGNVLRPLLPVLFYLDQDDTDAALRRLYALRGEEWVKWALEETTAYQWFQSRGLKDFEGWIQFFVEWREIAGRLFNDWPDPKRKVMNPHADWARSYREMYQFIGIRENGQ